MAKAIEAWIKQNRDSLETHELRMVRIMWATIHDSPFRDVEFQALSKTESRAVMALFEPADRSEVSRYFRLIRRFSLSPQSVGQAARRPQPATNLTDFPAAARPSKPAGPDVAGPADPAPADDKAKADEGAEPDKARADEGAEPNEARADEGAEPDKAEADEGAEPNEARADEGAEPDKGSAPARAESVAKSAAGNGAFSNGVAEFGSGGSGPDRVRPRRATNSLPGSQTAVMGRSPSNGEIGRGSSHPPAETVRIVTSTSPSVPSPSVAPGDPRGPVAVGGAARAAGVQVVDRRPVPRAPGPVQGWQPPDRSGVGAPLITAKRFSVLAALVLIGVAGWYLFLRDDPTAAGSDDATPSEVVTGAASGDSDSNAPVSSATDDTANSSDSTDGDAVADTIDDMTVPADGRVDDSVGEPTDQVGVDATGSDTAADQSGPVVPAAASADSDEESSTGVAAIDGSDFCAIARELSEGDAFSAFAGQVTLADTVAAMEQVLQAAPAEIRADLEANVAVLREIDAVAAGFDYNFANPELARALAEVDTTMADEAASRLDRYLSDACGVDLSLSGNG